MLHFQFHDVQHGTESTTRRISSGLPHFFPGFLGSTSSLFSGITPANCCFQSLRVTYWCPKYLRIRCQRGLQILQASSQSKNLPLPVVREPELLSLILFVKLQSSQQLSVSHRKTALQLPLTVNSSGKHSLFSSLYEQETTTTLSLIKTSPMDSKEALNSYDPDTGLAQHCSLLALLSKCRLSVAAFATDI